MCESVTGLGSHPDNLKLQKLAFLFELRGQERRLRVGHYKFFRYRLGPYSKVLARDIERLEDLGFVTKASRRLTARARFLLEYARPEIDQAALARDAMLLLDGVAREYGKIESPRLVDMVYAMEVPVYDLGGQAMKVRQIESFLDILDPLHTDLGNVVPFSEDLAEVFREEMLLRPESLDPASASYKAVVKDALEKMNRLCR